MAKFSHLIKKFDLYDIPLILIDEENEVIYGKFFIVRLEEDGRISVIFHVSTIPEDVAVICFILKEVRDLIGRNEVNVVESYYAESSSKLIFGKDAFKKYEDDKKILIINRYEKEKIQDSYLEDDSKCFNC